MTLALQRFDPAEAMGADSLLLWHLGADTHEELTRRIAAHPRQTQVDAGIFAVQ